MTENEPMSFARNDIMRATEAALKAYDQGVEDGIRQERERIREALLSDEANDVAKQAYRNEAHAHDVAPTGVALQDPLDAAIDAIYDHIGLGAVTTEATNER